MENQTGYVKKQRFQNRVNIAIVAFLAIGAYFLFTEHRAHTIGPLLLGALPWILVAACLVVHLFLHHGHNHGDADNERTGGNS